jgi:hypothetical protein
MGNRRIQDSIKVMRHLRKYLIVVASVGIFIFAGLWCHEHYIFDGLFGSQGDRAANLEVVSGGQTNNVRIGESAINMFGRSIDAEIIVALLEKRADSIRPGPVKPGQEVWRDHRYTRSEVKIRYGAKILSEIKHPKALGVFVRLLDDPLFEYDAPDWLVKLGDTNAGPYLLKSWEKRPQYPFVYVAAFRELPYKPAAPKVIDTVIDAFDIQLGGSGMEYLFQTLEIISGEKLDRFSRDVMVNPEEVKILKSQLHDWWSHSPANINQQNN